MTTLAPQVTFDIKDESGTNAVATTTLPLHRPLFLLKSQKGKAGLTYYSTYSEAVKALGAETFNEANSTYFSPAAMFVKASMEHVGAWIYRLIPTDATPSARVLFATLQLNDIPQYQKDGITGARLLDVDGNWIPEEVGGVPVTAEGVTVTWSVENVPSGATYSTIPIVSTPVPDQDNRIKYPILAFSCEQPGMAGNNYGFEVFYDASKNTDEELKNTNSLMLTVRFKEQEYNSSTANFLRDDTSAVENAVSLIADNLNKATNINIGINNIIDSRFTGNNALPITVHCYSDNVKTIDNLCSNLMTTAETDTIPDECSTGYTVNFVSGVNPFSGIEYDNLLITNAVAIRNVTNYLTGGADGTITWANENTMVRNFLNLNSFPEVEDEARFPITSIIDVGYSMDTKYAMIDFLDIRKDVNITLSPYQHGLAELTQAEEFSVGQALRTRALLTQESIKYATEACRACIMLQSGVPVTSVKNMVVPGSYWVVKQLAKTYNSTYLGNPMLTYPYSVNDLFKKLNWYPIKMDYKNKLYSNGLNYTQWLDSNVLHVAALRTVTTNDTSKLVDFPFVVICGFIRQLVRYIGMKYTGSELPKNLRHYYIQKEVEKELATMLNNQYFPEVSVDQTTDEAALGYVDHVYINLPADKAMTLLAVDLIVKKPTSN